MGRGRGVGAGLGVGVCLGVDVAVGVADADAVAVAVGVAVAVAVGVPVDVGVGLTAPPVSARISQLPGNPKSSMRPMVSLLPILLISTGEPSLFSAHQLCRCRGLFVSMPWKKCTGPLFIGVISPTKKLVNALTSTGGLKV